MITRLEGRKSKTAVKSKSKKVDGSEGKSRAGMTVPRYFTVAGEEPFDAVTWELRTAAITGESGKVYFEQKDIEVPTGWSQTATNVVAQKYFRGIPGTPQRERSVR